MEQPNVLASGRRVGDESEEHLIKVQDLPGCSGLPSHIHDVLTLKGEQDFISIHELAARLCHILLVETGFIPWMNVTHSASNDLLTPEAVMEMPDVQRVPGFSRKLSPSVIFSEHGIYALKYKVVLCHLVDLHPFSGGNTETSGDVEMMDVTEGHHDGEKTDNRLENGGEKSLEQEFRYSFSNDVNVTMMVLDDRLNITATSTLEPEGRPVSLQFTLNIEEFFTKRAKLLPVTLRGDQWSRKFAINYTRLSVYFKNKFAIHFLDQMDAVVFERRGLFSLPYLVLGKILKKSDVVTILRMSRTCTYFYNIVRDNRLWKFLLKRDFPNEPPEIVALVVPHPRHPGLMAPPPTPAPRSTSNTEPSSPHEDDLLQKLRNDTTPDEPDYYDIYKQKYATKYRRLLRNNSVPFRLFPRLGMGRRFPSVPLNFDRF